MLEDLDTAEEVIDSCDSIELYEAGYLEHAQRWVSESIYKLDSEVVNSFEDLRSQFFQHCVNDSENIEDIKETAEELRYNVSDAIEKLELVQKILYKIDSDDFES